MSCLTRLLTSTIYDWSGFENTHTNPDSPTAWWISPFADALTPYNDYKHCSCTIRLHKLGQPPQVGPLGFWRSGRHQPLCWGPWAGRAFLAGSGEPCDTTQIGCCLSGCLNVLAWTTSNTDSTLLQWVRQWSMHSVSHQMLLLLEMTYVLGEADQPSGGDVDW